MEKELNNEMNKAKEALGEELDLDEFDNRLDELKESIKKLKKLKKRQEKYEKLEKEKEHILRKMDRKESDSKHKHK
jgi:sugar-specific transcriptional regulator TrmB